VFDRKTWVPTSDPNDISHGTLKIEGEALGPIMCCRGAGSGGGV